MDNLVESLMHPEVVGAIVGVVLGAALAWFANWFRQRRGNRVVISRISQSPQINISERVRENLKITYKDTPVDQLVLNVLRMTNAGVDTLNNIHLKLIVAFPKTEQAIEPPANRFFIEVEPHDPLDKTEVNYAVESASSSSSPRSQVIDVFRPFLNPRRKYEEEEIEFAILSNSEIRIAVEGGGAGWYARFSDYTEGRLQRTQLRVVSIVFSFCFGILASVLASMLSISSLGFYLALLLVFLAVMGLLIMLELRIESRS